MYSVNNNIKSVTYAVLPSDHYAFNIWHLSNNKEVEAS